MPGPRTAVVCDDDAVIRSVLARMLSDAGYRVVGEVDNANEAIDVARLMHPDVIVLDLNLPGVTGFDALPGLREVSPDSYIVICTAFDTMRGQLEQAGVHAIVDKADLGRLNQVLAGI